MTCHELDISVLLFATSSHAQQKAAGSARQIVCVCVRVATARRTKPPAVRQPSPYGPDLCAPSSLTYPPAWVTIGTTNLQV